MNTEQITQEIRDISDRLDRMDVAIDDCIQRLDQVHERAIPAALADVKHAIHGHSDLIVNQYGTVAKLAQQLAYITDQVQVLERAIDAPSQPLPDPAFTV